MEYFSLIIFTLVSLCAQEGERFQRSNPNEYIRFYAERTQNEITSLIGNWKLKSQNVTSTIEVPFLSSSYRSFEISKEFNLNETYKAAANTLRVFGLRDNAIIKLNGQIIFSYYFNGAPLELTLDPDKLYFGRKNTIEFLIEHRRDFSQSIPRKPIGFEPQSYGGIGEVFIEHQAQASQVDILSATREGASALLRSFAADSARFRSYVAELTLLSESLDTLRVSRRAFRRGNLASDTVTVPIRLRRREQFNLPDVYYSHLRVTQYQRGVAKTYASSLTLHTKPVTESEPKRIIAKIEAATNGSPFLSMERMEDDVRQIRFAGFTGIYFPHSYPHPFYTFLAKKYGISIYVGLPTNSLTTDALKRQESVDYLKNLQANPAHAFTYISKNDQRAATFESLGITPIAPHVAEYKNYDGYLNPNNEETQAKHFSDKIGELKSNYLVSYFTDYYSALPTVRGAHLSNSKLQQVGLLTLDRKEKKAFRVLKSIQADGEKEILNPGELKIVEEYTFLIIGMFLFAIFVIGFKQATRLSDNLKRTFFHTHGFFSDTRDRRILYMGQSFFLGLMNLLIAANVVAAILFFSSASESLHYVTMYLVPDSLKGFFVQTFNDSFSTFFLGIFLILLVTLKLFIIFKLISLTGRRSINTRQILTVIIWGFAPVLFLIPVSMFAFNTLQSGEYADIMMYIIYFIMLWAFSRLINGLRVVVDTTRFKVFFLMIVIICLGLATAWGILSITHEINDYLPYFSELISQK